MEILDKIFKIFVFVVFIVALSVLCYLGGLKFGLIMFPVALILWAISYFAFFTALSQWDLFITSPATLYFNRVVGSALGPLFLVGFLFAGFYQPRDHPKSTASASADQVLPAAHSDTQAPTMPRGAAPSSTSIPSPRGSPEAMTYRIAKLPNGDLLNVRQGPGSTYPIVVKLQGDQGGIILLNGKARNGGTMWQEVSVLGNSGWVNAAYLVPESP